MSKKVSKKKINWGRAGFMNDALSNILSNTIYTLPIILSNTQSNIYPMLHRTANINQYPISYTVQYVYYPSFLIPQLVFA